MDIQNIVRENQFGSGSIVLQLHSFWKNTYKTVDAVRLEQQRTVWAEAFPVLRELSTAICSDPESVLGSIVTVCILLSGLGSPTAPPVIKETFPALRSVLKTADVEQFAELSPAERQQQVLELAQIVMGIRLFNKDCLRGGAGIDDLPELLSRAMSASIARVHKSISAGIYRLDSLTDAVLAAYSTVTRAPVNMEAVKTALCFSHLHYRFLRDLLKDLRSADRDVNTCVNQLRDTLLQLHETVRYRSAIPTIQVYPLFVQLSAVWRELQTAAVHLNHINTVLQGLEAYVQRLGLNTPLQAKGNLEREKHSLLGDIGVKCQLRGFCPSTLVMTGGGLVLGSFVSKGFAFASPAAAESWTSDPARSILELRSSLKGRPHIRLLIGLNVDDETPANLVEEPLKVKVEKHDAQMQTEVHPVSSAIEKDYSWSEWQLKRQALHLARLTQCVTRGQQTNYSTFRADSQTQTVRKKHKQMQTR